MMQVDQLVVTCAHVAVAQALPSKLHVCMLPCAATDSTMVQLQMSFDMADSTSGLPRIWSAEEPHLYVLVISLVDADGGHIESESCQVIHVWHQQPDCFVLHALGLITRQHV